MDHSSPPIVVETTSASFIKSSQTEGSENKSSAQVSNAFCLDPVHKNHKELNDSTDKPLTSPTPTTLSKDKNGISQIPVLVSSNLKQKLLNNSIVKSATVPLATNSTKCEKGERSKRTLKCGSKVACDIRKTHLDVFLNECLKYCSTESEARQMALIDEQVAFDWSNNTEIYLQRTEYYLKELQKIASDMKLLKNDELRAWKIQSYYGRTDSDREGWSDTDGEEWSD